MSQTKKQPRWIETAAGTAFAIGNAKVADYKKLALLCSNNCPGDLILKTYDFARLVRGSGLVVVSGFHSPIEKDCLPIMLRGTDPIIIVQAHRLSTRRLPTEWQTAIDAERLLLLSPFEEKDRRVTTELATERNRFVASISDEILIPHAAPNSKTETLFHGLIASSKRVYTFESQRNAAMISAGAVAVAPDFFRERASPVGA